MNTDSNHFILGPRAEMHAAADRVVRAALAAIGKQTEFASSLFVTPPKPEMGDLALPCFSFAKELGKSPADIASEVAAAANISDEPLIESVSAEGSYINFVFSLPTLAELCLSTITEQGGAYGKSEADKEAVMVEFFHANTHKGVHIGHLRTASIGSSLCNLLEAVGKKVIRVNYQGDIGPHVAKALWAYTHYDETEPQEHKGIWLGQLYARATKDIKENPAFEEEVKVINTKIYKRDPEILDLWEKTRQWCLNDFNEFYSDFGVAYDRLYFESEVEERGKEVVEELLEKGIARVSEGAKIVDLEQYDLGVYVGITGDGHATYQGKELGLAELKLSEYSFNRSIHVVGSEQELYFKQIFKTLELMGSPLAGKSQHLSYGLVMLPEGKMSSRHGTMVLYHDLFTQLFDLAQKGIEERHNDLSDDEVARRAQALAFGALKFAMIVRDTSRTMVFDWKQALDFEGDTGPYVQYAYARCFGILEKGSDVNTSTPDYSLLTSPEERALLLSLSEYPGVVRQAAEECKPYLVARYVLELARSFNEFYHADHVLGDDIALSSARLSLVSAVARVLRNAMNLLGMAALEQM